MTITRGYDAADRLTTITYPLQGSNGPNTPGGGQVITRTFTPRNQLASVTMDPDGSGPAAATSVADFTYNPGMRETHRGLGNGLARDTTYGRADNLVTAMTVQEDVAVNPAQRPGLSWSYTYDANKNLETATTGGLMSNYSFTIEQDDADRLSKWLRPNGELSEWALSLVGDWKTYSGSKLVGNTPLPFSQDRTHNPVHEIKTIDSAGAASAALFYDPKGNLTTDEEGQTYTYDFDNQLREVKDPNGTYEYDALGRRVTKQLYAPGSAATTSRIAFMWLTDPASGLWQLLAEYEQNTLARTYSYGEYVDEPLTLTVHGAAASAGTYWYHRDWQYYILGLTNASGTVVERYAYTPYGERRVLAADEITVRQTSGYGNPVGHQGLWHDVEVELVYNRFRYRSCTKGRWLTRDHLLFADGLNLYLYLRADVLNGVDYSGWEWEDIPGDTWDDVVRAQKEVELDASDVDLRVTRNGSCYLVTYRITHTKKTQTVNVMQRQIDRTIWDDNGTGMIITGLATAYISGYTPPVARPFVMGGGLILGGTGAALIRWGPEDAFQVINKRQEERFIGYGGGQEEVSSVKIKDCPCEQD